MPLLVGEVGPQFPLITLAQCNGIEKTPPYQKLHIGVITRMVSGELGENEIMQIKREQAKVREAARRHFLQASLIILRYLCDCYVLHMNPVLLCELGTRTRDCLDDSHIFTGKSGYVIDVCGWPLEPVEHLENKPSETVELNGPSKHLV